MQRGTGVGANIGKPMIGKTGTTENFGDAWFVGGTRKMTAAVWMGYPEGPATPWTTCAGIQVNGGSFPATIFKRFMSAAAKGVDTGTFPSPGASRARLLKGTKVLFSTVDDEPTGGSSSTVGRHLDDAQVVVVDHRARPGADVDAASAPPTTTPPARRWWRAAARPPPPATTQRGYLALFDLFVGVLRPAREAPQLVLGQRWSTSPGVSHDSGTT